MTTIEFERDFVFAMYGGDRDIIIEIFEEYLTNYNEMLQGVQDAFYKKNGLLEQLIHFHKSAFKFIGFSQLINECADLEKTIKSDDKVLLENKFNEFINCIKQTKPILEAEILLLRQNVNKATA